VIRVALLVPSIALRIGLRHILENQPDLRVVDELADPAQMGSVDQAADVLVASSSDTEALRALLEQSLPAMLLLTSDPDEVLSVAQSSLPVWGVLPEEASEEEILAAIHALGEGLIVGSPSLLTGLRAYSQPVSLESLEPLKEPLTNRELEILQFIAQGLANKQIALQLEISEHTVKFHLSSIYAKLGATNRTEAVNIGIRRGLISL
jgi:DNA-binding NarL/FixJ family response regulator